jgi:hypothetical protein
VPVCDARSLALGGGFRGSRQASHLSRHKGRAEFLPLGLKGLPYSVKMPPFSQKLLSLDLEAGAMRGESGLQAGRPVSLPHGVGQVTGCLVRHPGCFFQASGREVQCGSRIVGRDRRPSPLA